MPNQAANILLIWDRLGDYHRARWMALQKLVPETHVFAADLGASDGLYNWETTESEANFFVLSSQSVEKQDIRNRIKSVIQIIRKQKIKIVGLAGYGRVEYLIIILLSVLFRYKVILFAESWYTKGWISDTLKGLFLRLFCQGFLVSGIRAKSHFQNRLHISSKKIETGYSSVDNLHFEVVSNKSKDKKPVLLCVARFSEEKNLEMLITAFCKSKLRTTWNLKIVGGGKLKPTLEKLAENHSVELMNWVSYQELPKVYASADLFILPSIFEPWGLVANEAMAAGLPIILSEQCGCAPDLVDAETGYQFDAKNEDSLISLFDQIANMNLSELQAKGKAGALKIKNFNNQNWATNFIKLLR